MDRKLWAFRIDPDTRNHLQEIADTHGIDNTKALNMLINEYGAQKLPPTQAMLDKIEHELFLLKKYSNEIRRNNYLLLALLNAVCIELQVGSAPNHQDKTFQSSAFQEALGNLKQYMLNVQNQIASLETSGGGEEE